ncbi:hypothetical protein IAT38_000330 [Cryptococcus sp. DSM 104549]
MIKYDEAIAAQQEPFTSQVWYKLATLQFEDVGDGARMRLEDIPQGVSREKEVLARQKEQVLKGKGWGTDSSPSYRKIVVPSAPHFVTSIVATNIRAPIPRRADYLTDRLPPIHSDSYRKLISTLYAAACYPVCSLMEFDPQPETATFMRDDMLGLEWDPDLPSPPPTPSWAPDMPSPWLRWYDGAEERYVRTHDPGRYRAWEDERKAVQESEQAKLTASEDEQLVEEQTGEPY